MDGWGIGIMAVGAIAYFLSKKNKNWLFVVGFGAGLLTGAIWAVMVVNRALGGL